MDIGQFPWSTGTFRSCAVIDTVILGRHFYSVVQVMHRDLKLANLLIGANGRLKVGSVDTRVNQ